MLRSSYDVVIVGTDLPGLVFGALAAKKGYRVLVLGHGGKENVYVIEGHHFVRRPHLLFGFADSNPIREVFRELALAPEMRNLPRPLSPNCSVILPDSRIEITHMKGIFEEEIAREFPGQLASFRDFASRLPDVESHMEPILAERPILPPASFREILDFRRHAKTIAPLATAVGSDGLAPFGDDPRMRAFLSAPIAAMSGLSSPWLHPLPFVRLMNHLMRGLFFVEWGFDALKNLFLERIKNNSGDVRLNDHVDMLVLKRSRVNEVEVRARDEAIGVGVLVIGSRLSDALDLIPEPQAKRRYRARVEKVTPSHYMTTLNVGANREVIPEGMAKTGFVVANPGRPLEGSNYLVVQTDPAMEPLEGLDPARATISVSAFMPADRLDGKASTIERLNNEMLESLRGALPFLDRHRTVISSAALTTHPKTGKPIIDMAGLQPIYDAPMARSLDMVTWPVRTAYKNVLFLGDDSAGPLGFEGAFVSAFMAFDVLKKLFQLKNVM